MTTAVKAKLSPAMIDALASAARSNHGYVLVSGAARTVKALYERGLVTGTGPGDVLTDEGIRIAQEHGLNYVEPVSDVERVEIMDSLTPNTNTPVGESFPQFAQWKLDPLMYESNVVEHPFEPGVMVTSAEAQELRDEDEATRYTVPNRKDRRGFLRAVKVATRKLARLRDHKVKARTDREKSRKVKRSKFKKGA